MRTRLAVVALASLLPGCIRASSTVSLQPQAFLTVQRLPATTTPSPFGLVVRMGQVEELIPGTWEARALPPTRFAREGFVASPRVDDWERQAGTVLGTEAFWIDIAGANIPSDYFYLVAQGPALGTLATNRACHLTGQRVYLDHRPDFSGETFSVSDYVASGTGVCRARGRVVRWEYVVAAPGFGPMRQVGIPTSGLYVVIAASSGGQGRDMLRQMLAHTRFRNTSITQIVEAARHLR